MKASRALEVTIATIWRKQMGRTVANLSTFAGLLVIASVGYSAASSQVENFCQPNGALVGGSSCKIRFDGEISPGDSVRITRTIVESPIEVGMIEFNSSGGDPFEALKIADVLNKYFVSFSTSGCASACALIYLTANERFGTEVFLHRPTFPAAYFRSLPADQAERLYNSAVSQLRAELIDRGVPQDDVELIMRIPSTSVEHIRSGYPQNSPWMEEWLAAKCGVIAPPEIDPKIILCENDVVVAEQKRTQGHR